MPGALRQTWWTPKQQRFGSLDRNGIFVEALKEQYSGIGNLLVTDPQGECRRFSPSPRLSPGSQEFQIFEQLEQILSAPKRRKEAAPLLRSLLKLGLIGSFELEVFGHRIGKEEWRLLTIINGKSVPLCNLLLRAGDLRLRDLPVASTHANGKPPEKSPHHFHRESPLSSTKSQEERKRYAARRLNVPPKLSAAPLQADDSDADISWARAILLSCGLSLTILMAFIALVAFS